MGLDVGVVKTTYLEQPDQPIYDFLYHLAESPEGADWGNSWEGNSFLEFMRETLVRRANEYAREQNLIPADSAKLLSWVEGLPWVGGTIMLHLNW